MNKIETLKEKYFDKLESNCVEFTEIDEAGVSIVKEEFSFKTVSEMCEYLEMPKWVIDWTQDMILDEMKAEVSRLEEETK